MTVIRNGAEHLVDSLLVHGVDVCFANPGTSEMNFVAALDQRPEMRCVLGLFEGVVTGAADGYARMSDKPAATLLHLGPGLANGLANLHNARRARTPMINIIGDHADSHLVYDAPLTSDIESLATPMVQWYRRAKTAASVAEDTAQAWQAALSLPGVTALVLPVDVAWTRSETVPFAEPVTPDFTAVSQQTIETIAIALQSGKKTLILAGGRMLRTEPLRVLEQIAMHCHADMLAETFAPRIERGQGRPVIKKLPYPIAASLELLSRYDQLILVEAAAPVAFFSYPGKPSVLTHKDCTCLQFSVAGEDGLDALQRLNDLLKAKPVAAVQRPHPQEPEDLSVPVNGAQACALIAALLPENSIICDESVTAGSSFLQDSENAATHDYLQLTGGAIGSGIPLALGAAIACPNRQVINLQADGSAMYTVQGLWTQASEKLRITTVLFANAEYKILQGELTNLGINHYGDNAKRVLKFDDPAPDWVQIAQGLGVPAARAETLADLKALLLASFDLAGPFLIELRV